MTHHRQVLLFGSFTEDEIRSMQRQPQQNNVEITFGSLDLETLKSVGLFSTRVTDHPCKPNDLRLPNIAETSSNSKVHFAVENGFVGSAYPGNSNVTFMKENGFISSTSSGGVGVKELKQDHLEQSPKSSATVLTFQQPAIDGVGKLSSCLEDVVSNESSNGIHQMVSNQSNQQNVVPRNFLPRGLVNMGNLCFLNATLQALLSCAPFFELLVELKNGNIPENGFPTLHAFVEFISDFDLLPDSIFKRDEKTDLKTGKPFRPVMFDSILKSFTPDVPDNLSGRPRQEDAQEFLSFVMHQMHDELLKLDGQVSNGNGIMTSLVSSTHDESEDDNWETVGPKNKSAITRTQSFTPSKLSAIFGGQLRSVVKARGNKASATIQPFLLLHLNICPEPVHTIEDALRLFSAPETLEGYRTSAAGKAEIVTASKFVRILELSEILVLHLMRFSYESQRSTKLHKAVHFPLELLIGRDLLASPSSEGRRYELVATITHHGWDPCKGHYTADACHPSGKWLRYDDATVTAIPESEVLHNQAYVLFYKQL